MGEGWYRLAMAAGRAVLRGLDVTIRWSGQENLPTAGPVLLAANHTSYPDFVFIQAAARARGRLVRFLCRHDIWDAPICGVAMTGMRHIPVDREAPAGAYLAARSALRAGEAVCAFPEAGVSYSYTVRALMRGVASLGRETGAPVVPVAVWGGQRIFSVGRYVDGKAPGPDLTRGRVIDVRFGAPLPVAPEEDLTDWTRRLGATLTGMLEELQRLPEHRPRPGEYAPWYPAHLGGHAPDRAEAASLDSIPRSAVPPCWGPLLPG